MPASASPSTWRSARQPAPRRYRPSWRRSCPSPSPRLRRRSSSSAPASRSRWSGWRRTTRPVLHPRAETWLQPGYREDILVSFPEPGTYCIINGEIAGANNINAQESEPALLVLIEVTAPAEPLDDAAPAERVVDALVASANAVITDTTVRDRVVADLQDGMRLASFVKHRDIPAEEVTGQQTVGFQLAFPQFMIGEIEQDFLGGTGLTLANAAPYEPSVIHRLLPLGETQEWFLTSFGGGGHPFHIHVNPFQIVSVRVYAPPAGCFQRRVEGDPTQTEPIEVDTRPGCNIVPNDPTTWLDVSAPGSELASGPLESDGTGSVTVRRGAAADRGHDRHCREHKRDGTRRGTPTRSPSPSPRPALRAT